MWKKLKDTNYFLLLTDTFEIFITDFITIWFKNFSDTSFLTCLQESNFGLESNDNDLLQEGKKMLQSPDDLTSVLISENDTVLHVCMEVSDSLPIELKIKLEEGSKELFFQKVTQPLLKSVEDLRSSENELRTLLLKMELEIYLGSKRIPFNDEVHTEKHKVFKEHFGLSHIPESLLTKTVAIPSKLTPETNNIVVKQEPVEETPVVKTEPQDNIKTEIKIEPKRELQPSTVSPRKRHKRLNL